MALRYKSYKQSARAFQDNQLMSGHKQAIKKCPIHDTSKLIMGNWGPHKAKRICPECDKFIEWAKPKEKLC